MLTTRWLSEPNFALFSSSPSRIFSVNKILLIILIIIWEINGANKVETWTQVAGCAVCSTYEHCVPEWKIERDRLRNKSEHDERKVWITRGWRWWSEFSVEFQCSNDNVTSSSHLEIIVKATFFETTKKSCWIFLALTLFCHFDWISCDTDSFLEFCWALGVGCGILPLILASPKIFLMFRC